MEEDIYTQDFLIAENYHREGENAAKSKDFKAAEFLLLAAISSYPYESYVVDAKISLAVTYTHWRKNKKALKILKSLKNDKSLRKTFFLAKNYLKTKKYLNAIKQFEECINIDPNFIDSYLHLIKALKHLGKTIEIKKVKAELEKSNPNYLLVKKENKDIKFQKLTTNNVHQYIGDYNNGVKDGNGIIIFTNGDKYEGEFQNDLLHGFGEYSYKSGHFFTGYFKKGRKNGNGTYININGSQYIGEFKYDLMHGKGKLIFSEIESYEGDFRFNNIEGIGKYYYKNGSIYEGEFKNWRKEGNGKISYTDGRSYKGEFKNNKFNGLGIFKYSDGKIYEGNFLDGIPNGTGVLTQIDGEEFDCIYIVGKRTSYIKKNQDKSDLFVFFDTETTGLPKNWKAPISDVNNWPRLVQLAYILTNNNGEVIEKGDYIVKPEGFIIPEESSKIHRITNEKANKEGKSIDFILKKFESIIKKVDYIVAHNMAFDEKIIRAEFFRSNIETLFSEKKKICTMEKTTNYCAINGPYGYKWPKLSELYYKLFERNFVEAHDAAIDIKATSECFWELKKRNII